MNKRHLIEYLCESEPEINGSDTNGFNCTVGLTRIYLKSLGNTNISLRVVGNTDFYVESSHNELKLFLDKCRQKMYSNHTKEVVALLKTEYTEKPHIHSFIEVGDVKIRLGSIMYQSGGGAMRYDPLGTVSLTASIGSQIEQIKILAMDADMFPAIKPFITTSVYLEDIAGVVDSELSKSLKPYVERENIRLEKTVLDENIEQSANTSKFKI